MEQLEEGDSAELLNGVLDVSTGSTSIFRDGDYTITGSTNQFTITVDAAVNANITLDNVNIDVGGTSDAAVFKIADNSTGEDGPDEEGNLCFS